MKTSRTVVSILRAENVPEAVRKAVELAGGVEIRKDDTVVIKPNAKNQAPPGYGIVTDVAVIEPLVEMSLEKGARRVKIADGAAYPSGARAPRHSGTRFHFSPFRFSFKRAG